MKYEKISKQSEWLLASTYGTVFMLTLAILVYFFIQLFYSLPEIKTGIMAGAG